MGRNFTLAALVGFLVWWLWRQGREALPAAEGWDVSKESKSVWDLINDAAAKYGLSADLLTRQAKAESGGNPAAVSRVGAAGVFQLMPATAADLGVTDRFDAVSNIDGGARYMVQLIARYAGDVAKALAAYNWGMGRVDRTVAAYGPAWREHLPAETTNYLRKILG